MAETLPRCEATLAALPREVLAAVSGGLDSVALLEALVQTGRRPIVLHFNHGWRAESAREAGAVQALARGHNLRVLTGRAKSSTQNEAAGRALRYAFFARAARKCKIPHLVLAHQADDQVETFLLQLLRGSGAGGNGMDSLSLRDGLVLHRPWLGVWRSEIAAYARRRRLTWSDDPSNADRRHRRNLIRHRVLPYLKRLFGADLPQRLWRAAEIGRAESEWLDQLCAGSPEAAELSVRDLRAAPLARQRRTLLRWLQARGIGDVSFADVENVRRMLGANRPSKVNLSRGKFARRRAGRLFTD